MSEEWWVATAAAVAGLVAFVFSDVPVTRARLGKFALRYALTVTPVNAPHLVAYLALTRRWRAAGAVGGTTAFVVHGLQHQSIGISVGHGLAGWFAGAIVAELRAVGPVGVRGVANLDRRTVSRYVSTNARLGLAAVSALCLLVAVAASLSGSFGRYPLVPLIAGMVLPLLVLGVSRAVALRSQPAGLPELIEADEAIRRNAVQALHAAAITLMLYASVGPVIYVLAGSSAVVALVLTLVAMVGIPLLGWRIGPAGRRLLGPAVAIVR